MKAKTLALIYNSEKQSSEAITAIKENFVIEFKRLCNSRTASDYSDMAKVYRELEIKFIAFSLRVNWSSISEQQPEQYFANFMAEKYAYDIQRITKILGRAHA